jgi:Protein of unknown function (DUF1566)
MSKRLLMWRVLLMVVLGLCALTGLLSSAEAVLTIRSAAVVNGVAVVEGSNAPRAAPISWEGVRVTQANNGGNFSFQGVVPADCVGRLEDGVPADAIDVALANCSPVSEAPAPVPQTGQTQCWDPSADTSNVMIPCTNTGLDGDIQAGVPIPSPRFTDHGNGTVTDNLTGLIWLKNANCFGTQSLANALQAANTLANGSCGLSDGSVAGTWRLPNVKELQSLIHFGFTGPALSSAAGTGHWAEGNAFSGVQSTRYWSSTEYLGRPTAWFVSLDDGFTFDASVTDNTHNYVWPVRGGD